MFDQVESKKASVLFPNSLTQLETENKKSRYHSWMGWQLFANSIASLKMSVCYQK